MSAPTPPPAMPKGIAPGDAICLGCAALDERFPFLDTFTEEGLIEVLEWVMCGDCNDLFGMLGESIRFFDEDGVVLSEDEEDESP